MARARVERAPSGCAVKGIIVLAEGAAFHGAVIGTVDEMTVI
jgi:hypothetical protein